MKILRKGQTVLLGTLLTEVLEGADPLHTGQTALYVVSLVDERGFALSAAVHRAAPTGADPAQLRDRSLGMGAVEPLMAGAAGVETLARALESLDGGEPPDHGLLGWTVREVHRSGGVPVVMLMGGMALVTTLDTLVQVGHDLTLWAWSKRSGGQA